MLSKSTELVLESLIEACNTENLSYIINDFFFFHQFPWLEHLQKVLSNPDLSRNDTVVVLANDYLQNMLDLLRKTDKK